MAVKIGVLSFAHVHARAYADQVVGNERASLVAVWDHLKSRGRRAAQEFGVQFCDDVDGLPGLDIDAVVVNVETDRHPDLMVAAARAGKHIFTEKALAITVEECDRIIAAVEEANVKFMISLPYRSDSKMLLARKVVDDNSATIIEFADKGIAMVDVALVHRSGPNPFELFGTEGSLTMGAGPPVLTTTKLSDAEAAEYVASGPEALPSAMEQWIDAIEDGTEMSITIQDGRNLTELLQAAYMSSAQSRAIELPL